MPGAGRPVRIVRDGSLRVTILSTRLRSNRKRQPNRRQTMAKRDHDKDQDLDPAGAHGGDTGKSSFKGDGPQAEKGDQRREKPAHSGPTRRGSQDTGSQHSKRSGSESNAS